MLKRYLQSSHRGVDVTCETIPMGAQIRSGDCARSLAPLDSQGLSLECVASNAKAHINLHSVLGLYCREAFEPVGRLADLAAILPL